MIEFITGRAGSGKSRELRDRIRQELSSSERMITVIVPEQQTVLWESAMAEELPVSANLRVEITNFTRLSNSVFREYGGLADDVVDEGTRVLILWCAMLAAKDSLTVYYGNENTKGREDRNISRLLSAVDELKASGADGETMERALSSLEVRYGDHPEAGDLLTRFSDAVRIFAEYNRILHERFIDRGDLMANLARTLDKHHYFENRAVFIDSFFSMTAPQMRILEHIMRQADSLTMTFAFLPADENSGMQFREIREFYKDAVSMANRLGCECNRTDLRENRRHAANPALERIERYLFSPLKPTETDVTYNPSDSVRIIRCSDYYDEAEACASVVDSLLRSGMRARDIAVVARNMTSREGIVDTVLRRHGIPFFMSENSGVSVSPAVRFVSAALNIVAGKWMREDILRLIKTGLTPLSDVKYAKDGAMFELYTFKWDIRGRADYLHEWTMNPDGYSTFISDEGRRVLEAANRAREELIPPLAEFSSVFDGGAAQVETIARAIVKLAQDYNLAALIENECEANRGIGLSAEADKISRSWDSVCDILDRMVTVLGDTDLDAGRFSGLFMKTASVLDIGSIPTGCDEVVLGSANGVRFDSAKAVIILGSTEGEFPGEAGQGGTFFSSRDREELENAGITIAGVPDELLNAREYFMYYRCAAAASEKLYILAPTGSSAELSSAASQIRDMFPSGTVSDYTAMPLDQIVHSRASADYLRSRRADHGERELLTKLSEYGREDMPKREVPLIICRDSVPVSVYFGNMRDYGELELTKSKLADYNNCPYSYTYKYLFGAHDNRRAEISNADIGNFVHYVLEKYFSEIPPDRFGEMKTREELEKSADGIVESYISSLAAVSGNAHDSGRRFDGRLQYLFIRLKRHLTVFLEEIHAELAQSSFRPELFEYRVKTSADDTDDGNGELSFTTSGGVKVVLGGKADRVDTYIGKDGKEYIRVTDYKTGKKTFRREDVENGIDVQLMIYLFILQEKGIPHDGLTPENRLPGGAVYLMLKMDDVNSDTLISPDEAYRRTAEGVSRSGIYIDDEDVLEAMDAGRTGRFINADKKSDSILATAESFGELRTKMMESLADIAERMTGGESDTNPGDNCKYCLARYSCRISSQVDAVRNK